MEALDTATVRMLAWTFGFLLFTLLSFATGFLIKLLGELSKKSTQHEVKIAHLEDDVDAIHEKLFPVTYKLRKK